MRRFVFCIIFLFPFLGKSYYGYRSTEALLSFSAVVVGSLSFEPNLNMLNQEGPLRDEACGLVRLQTQHLMGIFQSESFIKEFGYAGVLGEKEQSKIIFTGIGDANELGWKPLHYNFETVVVFDKRAFNRKNYEKAMRRVPIKLPFSPQLIYSESVKIKKMATKDKFMIFNPCTDKDFNMEEVFWYFWDPDKKGCPLKNDHNKVLRVTGKLRRLRSTQVSYPEYDRLYGDEGNGENLNIAVFVGYIDDFPEVPNVDKSKKIRRRKRDDAYRAFQHITSELESMDFNTIEQKNGFRVYRDGDHDGNNSFTSGFNFLRKFEKRVRTELGNEINVNIQVVLADTDIHSRDYTFHYYAIPAIEQADIFLYDGHSGLGSNFDLTARDFRDIKFNDKKYQIFFFNGCSTYPYFGGQFARAKGGTENFDVITSGLQTLTETSFSNALAFLEYFLDGKTRTYQQILENIDKSNYEDSSQKEFTYLMGVNGDEDNVWTP